METYQNRNGNSNVVSYELGPTFIRVRFGDGAVYLYTVGSCGRQLLDEMKKLARDGCGLNGYIGRVVKKQYARKER